MVKLTISRLFVKQKNDLPKQNVDLVTEKSDLEKKLQFSEEQLKILADERSDLSKQVFEGKRESQTFLNQIQILVPEDQTVNETPEGLIAATDVDFLRRSLVLQEENNVCLNKQINDAFNENKKLQMESEQLKSLVKEEQKSLKDLRLQLMTEEDNVRQLSKDKSFHENKSVDLTAEVLRNKSSLTELQNQNKALNRQVSDLLNDNKKMKLEIEESQTQLTSQHAQLEKVSRDHLDKQQSLSQLTRDKLAMENKISTLTAEVLTLKDVLSQKEDLNSELNRQGNDLENENWKLKKEMEQLEVRLKSEVDHLEAIRKAKNDLHKKNMNLVTEKSDLEKQLQFSEEQLKTLAEERSDLSKQVFEGKRESQTFLNQMKILEDQKVLLEKENSKYKTEIHSSDSVCDEARHDLKHTKEKLKKLELKCRQYESELVKVTTSNDHLASQNKSLEEELETKSAKVVVLTKQNGETRKLLKERTVSYNQIEREKSLLSDQVETLNVKKVQAESSRDKLLTDYEYLATKVDSLEQQLKDSSISMQKNKDEQDHLQQQAISLQNKVKLKETVVKDLEDQHDELHEQLKDLQHNLNKSEIDLKHLEEDNQSLEQQVVGLQKQLKKTSSHLEVKDNEIDHLQENIFNLEQKIKDNETAQKRMLEEKRMSEDVVQELQQRARKQESLHKQLRQQTQELEEQMSGLHFEIQSKELLRKKSAEEVKSLQARIEEKDEALKKMESGLKKVESKMSSVHAVNVELQHRVKQSEVARKQSEDQTDKFRQELNRLKEEMTKKARKDEMVATDRVTILTDQLSSKEEYCKALENKVIECQKQILNLKREYEKPVKHYSEGSVGSVDNRQPALSLNKAYSEPRSSFDYRHHTESKVQEKQDRLVKELEMDNSDLKNQIGAIKKKLNMAESSKKLLEDENLSLWKTLYGSQDDKTDIIKTLEVKNNDLQSQVLDLERKFDTLGRDHVELEAERNDLFKALYGKDDDHTEVIKRLEDKSLQLKQQLEIVQTALKDSEKSKENLKEEKDALWKSLNGKKDEKSDLIKTLQLKNIDFKVQVESFKKELEVAGKNLKDLENEKDSLLKTLYGKNDEKSDITMMFERKNNELKINIQVLEKKLEDCQKAKADVEEKKNTLWKTLYGNQDEKTQALKLMEEKNNELKVRLADLEKKLGDASVLKVELEEEKEIIRKTMYGSDEEKNGLLREVEIKNVDLKDEIEGLKIKLNSSEKAREEINDEKNALWRTLYGSENDQADIVRNLEMKIKNMKGHTEVLEKKLEMLEQLKRDLEGRVKSLKVTLYGSQDEKYEAVRSLEKKNGEFLAQVEALKNKVAALERDKSEIEDERASLWKTLCGSEDEQTDLMRQLEKKNRELIEHAQSDEKQFARLEQSKKEMEEERDSLWKTLNGSENEQNDFIKKLEQKNVELTSKIREMEKKLMDSLKLQETLEEEKHSLWKALHGSEDERVDEIKALEVKNSELRSRLEVLEEEFDESQRRKNEFEKENNDLWKDLYGSQDEKAVEMRKLNLKISNFKSQIQNLESGLKDSENVKNDLEKERKSLGEKLSQSVEGNSRLEKKLELKDSDFKNQTELLNVKLDNLEKVRKALEEERNSLMSQLLGDTSGEKLKGMLKETQVYADQVKTLEQEVAEKNNLLIELKGKLFQSETSVATQKTTVEHLNQEISAYKALLEKTMGEREWFESQYIDSQRELVHMSQPTAEVNEKDMLIVNKQNMELKNQVTELISQLSRKNKTLCLPPVNAKLISRLEAPILEKAQASSETKDPTIDKRAELEMLQVEKNYLHKVLMDLKKQAEFEKQKQPHEQQENVMSKRQSEFSEAIAKQLALHGPTDAALKEEMEQLREERDRLKKLVNTMQSDSQFQTSLLRDPSPATFSEAESVKLRKENADLKSKLVELHARVKKRESLIKALSDKVVQLSQALKNCGAASRKPSEKTLEKADSISALASQIAEQNKLEAKKRSSAEFIIPDFVSSTLATDKDSQLFSLLHPSLLQSASLGNVDIDSKTVQKLRYEIEELENQLEDTKMDNYRLQEEVNTMLLEFGIQNNKLVCEKCGKSVDIVSMVAASSSKLGSKFTSFRRYLEKDPMFSKEESINKLSECKWKLQNEVLNMQKKLCVNKPSYLENQENFNNHIERIAAMEFKKIPVKIFSEPYLSTGESIDVVKNSERLNLLWKSQVLHLERDIKCLRNFKTFLEQFVLSVLKEVTNNAKQMESDVKMQAISQRAIIPVEENDIGLSKSISKFETQCVQPGVRGNSSLSQISSGLFAVDETAIVGLSSKADSKIEVARLQNQIKEQNKRIGGLQSENKNLQTENKKLALECKKHYRSRNREKQLEKQIEDLNESLNDLEGINRSLQVELDTYHQLLQEDRSKVKPTGKQLDDYVRKSQLVKALNNMKSLNSELERLGHENNMLRKKGIQLSSPASKSAKSRVLQRAEESSSDKESEGTVTLSHSSSLDSMSNMSRHEIRTKKREAQTKPPTESQKLPDQRDANDRYYDDPQRGGGKYGPTQDTAFHRSHFSSPDLGIESDSNHELFFSEQQESDEKSYAKTYPLKQPISVAKTRPARTAAADSAVTAMWDSAKTAAVLGASLHAIGPLKDYNLLKKEVQETLVLIKGMLSRTKECLEYQARTASPIKNLGYTTLKELLSSMFNVKVCQEKSLSLVNNFWVSSLPDPEKQIDVVSVLRENQELTSKMELMMEEKKKLKWELQEAFERLKVAQLSKSQMEKAISKQLTRTKKVLKQAKSNLEEPEPHPKVLKPATKVYPSVSSKHSAR